MHWIGSLNATVRQISMAKLTTDVAPNVDDNSAAEFGILSEVSNNAAPVPTLRLMTITCPLPQNVALEIKLRLMPYRQTPAFLGFYWKPVLRKGISEKYSPI